MGGFFGGNEKKETEVKSYEANPLTKQYAAEAQAGVANADPFSQMTARNIAPMTADQLASFQGIRNAQGMTNPYFTAAQDYLQQGSTPIDMGRVGDLYKNIYDPLARSQSDLFNEQMTQTTGNATQAAGGTGADRIGVAQAMLAKQQGLARGELGSKTMQQALDQYNQEKMRQQSAAVLSGNLGLGSQGANLQAIGALNQMGGQQMQFEQLLRDAPWVFQNQKAMQPLQQAMMQGQLTAQLAPGLGGTTTSNKTSVAPEQGWGAPLIGAGLTAAGLFTGNPMLAMSGAGMLSGKTGGIGGMFGGGGKGSNAGGGYGGSPETNPNLNPATYGNTYGTYSAQGGRVGMQDGGGVGGAVKRPAFDALMNFAKGGSIDKADGGELGDDFNSRFGASFGDNYDVPNPLAAAASKYMKDQQRFDPTPDTTPLTPDDAGSYDMPRPPELGTDLGNIGDEPKWGIGVADATTNPAIESDRRAGYDPQTDPAARTAMAYASEEEPRPQQPLRDFSGRRDGAPTIPPPPPGSLPRIPDFGSIAQTPRNEFAQSPGFALMNAGLGILKASGERDAQGFNKGFFHAIGAGGQEGMKTAQLQQQQAREDKKLELSAQKHLFDAQKDLLPYSTETVGGKRGHDIQQRELELREEEARKKWTDLTASEKANLALKESADKLAWATFGKQWSELTPAQKENVRLQSEQNTLARDKFNKEYSELTAAEKERIQIAREKMQQEEWDIIGPLKGDPSKTVTHNKKTNEYRIIDVGVGPKAGSIKMPEATNERLVKIGTNATNITGLVDNFQDDYGGHPIKGSIENWAARNLNATDPRIVRQANWWQAHAAYKAQVRHELYGAALTAYEIAQWEQQDIRPGMSPELIKENLARQKRIVDGAMRRKALSLVATGQDQEAVEAALGFKIDNMPDPIDTKSKWKESFPDVAPKGEVKEKTPASARGTSKPGEPETKVIDGVTYTKRNGKWYGPGQ